jgi:transposase
MAYSSRLNLQAVANEGGKAYIPYRKNATGKSRGSTLWSKMYHYFQLNRDEFMDHYHKRSNIEATNAAIKRKFGETLKSKNPTAQVNELLAKIIAYNLTVVIHEMYENGIRPEFLQLKSEVCNQSQAKTLL